MSTQNLFGLKQLGLNISATDTTGTSRACNHAAILTYMGNDAVHTAVLASTTLTLTDDNGAHAFDLSTAAYDTFYELRAAIRALNSVLTPSGWDLILTGGRPEAAIYSSNLKINTFSVQTVTPQAGVVLTWNTSNSLKCTASIGPEGDPDLAAPARTSELRDFSAQDPGTLYNNMNQYYHNAKAANLQQANVNITSSGTITLNIYKFKQSDTTSTLLAGPISVTSATNLAVGSTYLGNFGPFTNPGEHITMEVVTGSGAFSAGGIQITTAQYGEVN